MHFFTILSLTLTSLVIDTNGASLPDLAIPLSRRLHFVVPRTLQDPTPGSKESLLFDSDLTKRQSTVCSGGDNCVDGGCCPSGYHCYGAFTASSGCCRDGQVCTGPPTGCADPGWVTCTGTDGCCPTLRQCPFPGQNFCLSDPSNPATTRPPTTTTTRPATIASAETTSPNVNTRPSANTNTDTVVPAAITTTSRDIAATNNVTSDATRAKGFIVRVGSLIIATVFMMVM